jgi:hypothetical protein
MVGDWMGTGRIGYEGRNVQGTRKGSRPYLGPGGWYESRGVMKDRMRVGSGYVCEG